jgi:hypothetical protein
MCLERKAARKQAGAISSRRPPLAEAVSSPRGIAETFAAVDPRKNRKIQKDLTVLLAGEG